MVSQGRCRYPTRYRHAGWAEQDPGRWWEACRRALASMASRVDRQRYAFAGLALTGQCPTYLPVDRHTQPLGCALTYQDNRAGEESAWLQDFFGNDFIHGFSGHSAQPFYILPKVLWHKHHDPQLYDMISKALQPSDYVTFLLTGELATNAAHAAGTLAFDLAHNRWNDEFIAAVGLKDNLFPGQILQSWDVVGALRPDVADECGLPRALPVVAGGPDSQCCCLGVGAIEPGILSNMSGTSTCLNSTVTAPVSDLRVGNYAHVLPSRWTTEVGLNTTGASLSWAAKRLFPDVSEKIRYQLVEKRLHASRPGARGLLFLPYLTGGERDNQRVKGGLYNVSMEHDDSDILRAVLEGVVFAERERIELLTEAGCHFESMRISGGGATFDLWNHIRAASTGLPVLAAQHVDAAELGAAILAGIGTGVYSDAADAVRRCHPQFTEFEPKKQLVARYEDLFQSFLKLERSLETEC